MKLLEWLKNLFTNKRASSDSNDQTVGFIIIDSQEYIHTKERI